MFHLVADENADFTEANLDLAVRLTDGPGDLEGMVLADAPRVTVATATAPEQWIDWPGASLPADIQPAITTGNPGQALSSRSEEHTSELQSLMRISYAVFCLKKKK